MIALVGKRLAHLVAVLLLVSFALTFLLDLTPGDPAYAILGDQATPEQIAVVHDKLNLDDPLLVRYWDWLSGVVKGDFGRSYQTDQPVLSVILQRLPVSAELIVFSMLLSLLLSIPLGMYAAYRADGAFDRVWSLLSSIFIATPAFVSALLLVFVFALQMKGTPLAFPATGWVRLSDDVVENVRFLFLPALTLTLLLVPQFSRLLRADMISTLQEDFVGAARAKGVPNRRILFRHVLRPSSFSLLTLAGLSLGALIGGAVIVENLFALPGLGQVLYQAIQAKDVLVVRGIVMFIAIAYVVINAVVDVLYGYLDPRVRAQQVSS